MIRTAYWSATRRAIVAGLLTCIAVAPAIAQSRPASQPSEIRVVRVYALRYADPATVARAISALLPHATAVADQKTHAVVVASPEALDPSIEGFLKQIDVPPSATPVVQGPKPEVRILEVRERIDEAMESAAKMVVDNQGSIAVLPGRKMIIIKAMPSVIKELEDVVYRMADRQEAESKAGRQANLDAARRQYRIRLVWLVGRQDGAPPQQAEGKPVLAPPDDLKPVVNELAGMGIKGLCLASQTIVATTNEKIQADSCPTLPASLGDQEGTPCQMRVTGRVSCDREGLKDQNLNEVALSVEVNQTAQPRSTPLCRLETTVVTPMGQAVVLGTTALGNLNSVFVLQLLPGN